VKLWESKNVQENMYVWHVEQGWRKTRSFTKCKIPKWDKSFQAFEIYKQLSQAHEILKDFFFQDKLTQHLIWTLPNQI